MTVLCATHFTDLSFAAVKVAGQVARTNRQPLWLVEIVPPPAVRSTDLQSTAPVSDALAGEAARLLSEGVEVHTATLFGPLETAIRHFCTAKQAGLVVVGDSERTLGPLVVGPLDRFANRIAVPVLIVRDAKPFEAWALGNAPLKVMLALDRTWRSQSAREWISALAAFGRIDLTASYLWWHKDENERRAWEFESGETGQQALPEKLWVEAEAAFTGMPGNVRRRVRLEAGRPHVGPQLLRMANAERVDLFVLSTHPHRGPVGQQWSVSHEVLALAPMSVACIPEPFAASSGPSAARGNDAHLYDQVG